MEKNLYETKDLSEAAALLLNKLQMVRMEKRGTTCWFIFNDKEKSQELSNKFYFGGLMVNAREYYEMMATLKRRIFAI